MKSNVFQLSLKIKTLIEASCTNNMHTGETGFCRATFKDVWVVSFQAKYNKTQSILCSV